jgi:signal transduction histidine kinase
MGTFVDDFLQEVAPQVAQREVTLLRDGPASLGLVALHANTFRRALLNLVQNALDAMPQGGTLTLRGSQTASHVHLDVCDTGTGMPDEQLVQIFEPLYTTKPTGTGLGLYLVQEIVMAHGGEIRVMSRVDSGTTFTITLPLVCDAPVAS